MVTLRNLLIGSVLVAPSNVGAQAPAPDDVRAGLKAFFAKTARADGSFQPGIHRDYPGMSDSAYSDLAPTVYAVILHKSLGWKLPHEEKTKAFLLTRQQEDGAFVNVLGTADPKSAQARAYNTTQGLVALHALGVTPRFDPLPVFDSVLKEDYKKMPLYMTSFFPLAYLCAGKTIPAEADRKIRLLMAQADDGYLGEHIASTFHAAHYYRLIGETTPKANAIVKRCLAEQHANGSWFINPGARDRHATFDAVFTLRHLGGGRADVKRAFEKANRWVLSCRNADGGFGHFPGSPSDMDAAFFQVGALVMTGWLAPADPLPRDPHLLGWGHLMPLK
ncbi:MAG: prenyltransferase/squalene oxidase repeat-containing protein [Gemmataceae bacterium]